MPAPAGVTRGAPAEGPRTAAAHTALRKGLADGHRESVVDLAEFAWGDGALLESDGDADAWPAVAGSLLFVDELERAVEVAQAAARVGPGRRSPGCRPLAGLEPLSPGPDHGGARRGRGGAELHTAAIPRRTG